MTNGILIVNKPKNYTSRDVVNKVGKILKTKKIGHTGTLDPIATGVLVLTIGKATKLTDIITANDKEYIAKAKFGIETDTLDNTGNILNDIKINFSKEEIETVLKSFIGSYDQQVPIYSAVKINGKKLYEYARNNEKVDLPSRMVTIHNIELLDINNEDYTEITFKVSVSKGTYIRSLIRDIASKLNTYAIMTDLTRTKQGKFTIEESFTLEEISNNNFEIVSIKELFKDYKQIEVDDALEFKIRNGSFIKNTYGEEYVLFTKIDALALYRKDGEYLKPYKMFLD